VFVDADRRDAIEAGGVVDEDPLALGEDGIMAVFQATPRPSAIRATVRC